MPNNYTVVAQGGAPSRAAMLGEQLGGGIGQGVGALAADWLNTRRLSKQLNPMREALLAQMSADPLSTPTPQQQMILQAAQDPKTFARLAGSQAGALDLGTLLNEPSVQQSLAGQPRIREVIVHSGDDLNKSLNLGLTGEESAVVQLQYDENDVRLPGFTVEQYRSTNDNTDAPTSSSGLAEIIEINRAREREGQPLLTAQETEAYLRRKQQTFTTLVFE